MSEEKIGDFAACGLRVADSPTISSVAGRTQVREAIGQGTGSRVKTRGAP